MENENGSEGRGWRNGHGRFGLGRRSSPVASVWMAGWGECTKVTIIPLISLLNLEPGGPNQSAVHSRFCRAGARCLCAVVPRIARSTNGSYGKSETGRMPVLRHFPTCVPRGRDAYFARILIFTYEYRSHSSCDYRRCRTNRLFTPVPHCFRCNVWTESTRHPAPDRDPR